MDLCIYLPLASFDVSSERDALGCDEYHPISHKGSNISASGGVGYTVIDALDTMIVMGLSEDLKRARDWVENKLTFDREGTFSTFEVRQLPVFFLCKVTSSL